MSSDRIGRNGRSNYAGFRSERWLSLREVMESLGVHRITAGNYLRSGALPGVKMGGASNARWRVPVEAVDAFLAGDRETLRAIATGLARARQPAPGTPPPPAPKAAA